MPIQRMLVIVKADARAADERAFGRVFEEWWFGEQQVAWLARELRNDAAHRVYEKAPDGPIWRMDIAGRTIALADFAERYGRQLREFASLVERARRLAFTERH
jgi:hypothetical protein